MLLPRGALRRPRREDQRRRKRYPRTIPPHAHLYWTIYGISMLGRLPAGRPFRKGWPSMYSIRGIKHVRVPYLTLAHGDPVRQMRTKLLLFDGPGPRTSRAGRQLQLPCPWMAAFYQSPWSINRRTLSRWSTPLPACRPALPPPLLRRLAPR